MKNGIIKLMAFVFTAVLALSTVLISEATAANCTSLGKQHCFAEWQVETKPTCIANGKKTRKCEKCEYLEVAEIKATGHKYGTPQVVIAPTYYAGGTKKSICTECGYVLTEAIDKLQKKSVKNAKVYAASSAVYTGKKLTPAVTVTYSKKRLTFGRDYTVSYKNNKAYGTAQIVITGKGIYTAVTYKTFKIVPKPAKIKSVSSPAAIQLKVKWKTVSGASGYQIKYDTSSKFTAPLSKTVYASSGKTERLIRGLESGKKYYVKIRTFKKINGKKIYSEYSKVVTETAKKTAKKASSKNVICLTFDDGPSANVTPKILDTLKENNIKATFFIINYSKADKKLVQRIIDEGHTLGVHCYSHDYAKIYKSESQYMKYFNKLRKKIKKDFNYNIKFTRFPGGSSNMVSSSYCTGVMTALTKRIKKEGYTYVDWNVVSGDADGDMSASYIKSGSINGLQKKRTNVVLMHDASTKLTTAKALQSVIDYGYNNGYVFKPITSKTPIPQHNVAN